MSHAPQGPGWWQAPDLQWYPPEQHPNYAAPPQYPPPQPPSNTGSGPTWAPQPPTGFTPPVWQNPTPGASAFGGQPPPESLTAVKNFAAKVPITAWLIFGGLAFAIIALFLPWESTTESVASIEVSMHGSLTGVGRFFGLVLIAAAVWLAWPALSRPWMPIARLIGLTAVVVVLGGFSVVWFVIQLAHNSDSSDPSVSTSTTPDFGLLLYMAAMLAAFVGIVLIWPRVLAAKAQGI